jgi:hypothetical protein
MRAQIKLGRIAGITVGLHYSWFIIALLITLSLADHFHSVASQWSSKVQLWELCEGPSLSLPLYIHYPLFAGAQRNYQ